MEKPNDEMKRLQDEVTRMQAVIKNAENRIIKAQARLDELTEIMKKPPADPKDVPNTIIDIDYTYDARKEKPVMYAVTSMGDVTEIYGNSMNYNCLAENRRLFPTKEMAEEFAGKTQFIADCLLFKWLYDREYVPVWDGSNDNYCAVYQRSEKRYINVCYNNLRHDAVVYFSTKEIADKCAEWLNYRRKNEK